MPVKVIAQTGNEDLARVYVADCGGGRLIEMVESLQPPLPRTQKWVLIVSTLFGCPGACRMCDAGRSYRGRLSAAQIFRQIDFLVRSRYPDRRVPVEKFKIQFARMGDPALNPAVLEVLEELPSRYVAPGLLPCLSTIAPGGSDDFLAKLIEVKRQKYGDGRFQMQFSLHSTDPSVRDRLMPLPKWDYGRIAKYGADFYEPGDRKIALNFALAQSIPVDPETLARLFDPDCFLIKVTPLNPTYAASRNGLQSVSVDLTDDHTRSLVARCRALGFEVLVSVGETAENGIGSNCGQYVTRYMESEAALADAYGEVRCPPVPGWNIRRAKPKRLGAPDVRPGCDFRDQGPGHPVLFRSMVSR